MDRSLPIGTGRGRVDVSKAVEGLRSDGPGGGVNGAVIPVDAVPHPA